MRCYLIRHGKDDDTIRGGWSQAPLTSDGITEVESLSEWIANHREQYAIKHIYSSDLCRAVQTAQILANIIQLPVSFLPAFRETNNGNLAGLDNALALVRYPDLFWNQLEWEQCYPNGESPKQFYERILNAWMCFSEEILKNNENVALITHGGVIQVILSIVQGTVYSNKQLQKPVPHASCITLQYDDGHWRVLEKVLQIGAVT